MNRTPGAPRSPAEGRFGVLTLAYAAFVVYGSLVPLAFRYRPLADAWATFLHTPYLELGLGSRADWVANILLYIPLAFLATGWLRARMGAAAASLLVFIACALLAVGVEFAQLFFPPRTVSLNDLLAEMIGAALGITLWHTAGRRLVGLWDDFLRGGTQGMRALMLLYAGAYLAFALFPYDFVVSWAELVHKLTGAARPAVFLSPNCGAALVCGSKLAIEAMMAAPLGMLLATLIGTRGGAVLRAFGWGLALGVVIEGLQAFLASGTSQGVSILTRGLGFALGVGLLRFVREGWLIQYRAHLKVALLVALPAYGAALLAMTGYFGGELHTVEAAAAKLQKLNFLPFYYHYFTTETQAVQSLLLHAGAYAPAGLAVWLLASAGKGRGVVWAAALCALAIALGMETLKLFLVGKRPDPTNLWIAAAAAALACLAAQRLALRGADAPPLAPRSTPRPRRAFLVPSALAVGALAITGWVIAMQPRERALDETQLPKLAAGAELPPVSLARFRTQRPRLPHPSASELGILRRFNPGYLRQVTSNARGGAGDFHDAVLQAYAQPGSVDLDILHQRLMALQFSGRGHEQVKPLAVAYDWLHERWSDTQRAALGDKLAEGCEFVARFIREARLSPYNVILYNAPLQALMACAIALYQDSPRGEPLMRFTYDLWKHRVLPVWRQVMGRNGGWHEGGEYVGIGIGQAIYQVPAMWRHATGEDHIAAEPGIRGFLDFLIYRTRPDGMHFRWGNAGYLDRPVPDAVPLALELRHAAAYTLARPPAAPTPTSWPWGPLTDASLTDPKAIQRLPLTAYFDGIGLVVMRSDWSPTATYVTFKAGNNYWSHSHLDQGAFTVDKGGPLAIDSGFYGPRAGADHHMNYTMQTIAHNAITVTDPRDTVPAPGRSRPRPIANDGGQRRVGSPWGVEAAPLDLDEWKAKRETYHTGRIERLYRDTDITVAIADVTAAYTNRHSGRGTFSHRTRRVERVWRTFAYDRVDDVIVIFDQVIATDPAFRKRWLLHSIDTPKIGAGGFRVAVAPQERPGRGGGTLSANVLLPRGALLHPIGGPGFEFFVDNENYDEDGRLGEILAGLGTNRGEPGAWRVEVIPAAAAAEDHFLVVLLPSGGQGTPRHTVRLLESGSTVGAEIVGPQRTSRWWFEPSRNGVRFEVGGVTQNLIKD